MPSKYAFQKENLRAMFERPWELRLRPRQIFGNLYFVGNQDGASWLVKTGEGLVLFDTNYPTAAPLLLDSIWALGFDPRDITAIFHTHGHFDHFGATELLQALSGARTYLGLGDCRMFRQRPELALLQWGECAWQTLFTPDVEVADGAVFVFGDTQIRAAACPGHSPGATSYFFNVTDGSRTFTAGLHGGAGLNTLCRDFREGYQVDWRADFLRSLDKAAELPVDIFLGNHTPQNHYAEKAARMDQGEKDAFIVPGEWKEFLRGVGQAVHNMMEEEAAEETRRE